MNKRGFTLVEMLVAMTIFVAFTGILINSYADIVKSQRDANDYRVMYVEARRVFDTLTRELRDGMVDYGAYPVGVSVGDEIFLVSKDDRVKTHIQYDGETVRISKSARDAVSSVYSVFSDPINLNSDQVKVSRFRIYVSPLIDPYDEKYVDHDVNQFHPKVTIYAEFTRELRNGRTYTMDLQTTISSRIYNQVYDT